MTDAVSEVNYAGSTTMVEAPQSAAIVMEYVLSNVVRCVVTVLSCSQKVEYKA